MSAKERSAAPTAAAESAAPVNLTPIATTRTSAAHRTAKGRSAAATAAKGSAAVAVGVRCARTASVKSLRQEHCAKRLNASALTATAAATTWGSGANARSTTIVRPATASPWWTARCAPRPVYTVMMGGVAAWSTGTPTPCTCACRSPARCAFPAMRTRTVIASTCLFPASPAASTTVRRANTAASSANAPRSATRARCARKHPMAGDHSACSIPRTRTVSAT